MEKEDYDDLINHPYFDLMEFPTDEDFNDLTACAGEHCKNPRLALMHAHFWNYAYEGISNTSMDKTQRKYLGDLKRKASDLFTSLTDYAHDEEANPDFKKLLMDYPTDIDNPNLCSKMGKLCDLLQDLEVEFNLIISNKKRPTRLRDFVCDVASFYEEFSGRQFTSSHSSEDLDSEGEIFVARLCDIICYIQAVHFQFRENAKKVGWRVNGVPIYEYKIIPTEFTNYQIKAACAHAIIKIRRAKQDTK